MNKRLILVAVALGAMLLLAGCAGSQDEASSDELETSTGANLSDVNVGDSYLYEVKITEQNQQNLVRAQPPFQMDESLERQNLIDRYQYLNDRSNVHHVYMLSHDGKVMNYEVAQGKVSSVNSKLTNDVQIVRTPDCSYSSGSGAGSEGACYKTVESPQMDGSYGENGDAIFFFTSDGHYVEYNGIYVVSEEPKQITTEVTLVESTDEDDE